MDSKHSEDLLSEGEDEGNIIAIITIVITYIISIL